MLKVLINNTEYNFPSKLSEITLGQRIAYQQKYGDDIEARAKEIEAMEEGPEKELDHMILSVDMACKTFAFFSKLDEEIIKKTAALSEVIRVFSVMKELIYTNGMVDNLTQFPWNNETWTLYKAEVKNSSDIQFGEFIDSKQVIDDLIQLGKGSLERLPRLCAIYLRKEGEKYDPNFAEEDSDRVKLMQDLPMDIALAVGFFLTNLINSFKTLLASSLPAPSNPEGT